MSRGIMRILAAGVALALVPALCACGGGGDAARHAREDESLRLRVERLEREVAAERAERAADMASLRGELRALRAALDNASRQLARGKAASPEIAKDGRKSPHESLRVSLRGAYRRSRRALDRFGRKLESALTRKKSAAAAADSPPEEPGEGAQESGRSDAP